MLVLLAAALVSTGLGCGKGRVKVSPVRGKIVYNGQGIPGTTVMFSPVAPPNERVAKIRPFAYGDPDGRFELKTYVEGDGAPPGRYRVCIIAPTGGTGTSMKDKPVDELESTRGPAVKIPAAIAKKYANFDTAGIEVTIKEGQNELEPFVLSMANAAGAVSTGRSTISTQN